jgi:hypothetical protein
MLSDFKAGHWLFFPESVPSWYSNNTSFSVKGTTTVGFQICSPVLCNQSVFFFLYSNVSGGLDSISESSESCGWSTMLIRAKNMRTCMHVRVYWHDVFLVGYVRWYDVDFKRQKFMCIWHVHLLKKILKKNHLLYICPMTSFRYYKLMIMSQFICRMNRQALQTYLCHGHGHEHGQGHGHGHGQGHGHGHDISA